MAAPPEVVGTTHRVQVSCEVCDHPTDIEWRDLRDEPLELRDVLRNVRVRRCALCQEYADGGSFWSPERKRFEPLADETG